MSEERDETATEQVTFYLTPTERERLKREARESDSSISAYCASVFRARWSSDETDRVADRLNAEERIERISKRATDEIEESVEEIETVARNLNDLHARAATYPIVNFYAMKREFDLPEPWISDEFARAARKLRADPEDLPLPEGIDADDGETNSDGDGDGDGRPSLRERLNIDD